MSVLAMLARETSPIALHPASTTSTSTSTLSSLPASRCSRPASTSSLVAMSASSATSLHTQLNHCPHRHCDLFDSDRRHAPDTSSPLRPGPFAWTRTTSGTWLQRVPLMRRFCG
ncbi:hypothetical protein TOPH_08363 [Tolypocladium ophioglossoides CBS 100239]|uniref:Uncharacterized protein n=1 Tax=Tolypocladium ophioglossoides (strain CBS 100239) TaxID=1163406 RepID=A0A0L0MZT4_TOLOC|nr:hypothetical protein TOPH_08363 [Tolypocladium ophioglossoides CBS 100239]